MTYGITVVELSGPRNRWLEGTTRKDCDEQMAQHTRRQFIKHVGAGALAATALPEAMAAASSANTPTAPAVSTAGRILGANDRINVGFVGCGGRMRSHIRHIVARSKEKGDVQAVAVNDIWQKRKQLAREMTGVDEKSVYHDFHEVAARKDIDVIVIASPDHWHYEHTMAALNAGKDVYLEKPMTYTVDEARKIAEAVKANGRVLQVGSQYTSMDHFWKAKKAIADGLLGDVVWASGGFGRNSNARGGEWNYKIDPDATEQTLDWKAFIGSAPSRAWDPARYFRWRKYWDYSGGIATDLFYHTVSPLLLTIGPEFPQRVMASGGIYQQKDREVPDTFFLNADYKSWTMQLACSVASGVGAPLVIHGSQATLFVAEDSEDLTNPTMELVPDKEYKDEFVKKTGKEKLVIDVEVYQNDKHPHMENFLESVRSRKDPHFPAEMGYKAMAAIALGVKSYREGKAFGYDADKQRITD
jgi:predicted dehydrogenase